VAVTADGRAAVSGSADRTVRVWDLALGRCTATHPAGSEEARKAWVMAQDWRPVAPDLEPHGLTVRATADGKVVARFPGTFTQAACSADSHHVAGDGRGGVYLLRLHTRRG
jgi:WD40 repeat protein